MRMHRALLALALLLPVSALHAGAGRIIIVSKELQSAAGLNDPTPREPVGGNTGTTLGQQRMRVFEAAAERWNSLIDTDVNIMVDASFPTIPDCSATSAVLGQAAPFSWKRNFANAPQPNVWYPNALANALAKTDLGPTEPDLFMQFNAAVDNATCLGESDWYYGLDGQKGVHSDLFVVVLHELAHGLGFASRGTSTFVDNTPTVFDTQTLDLSSGQRWTQMNQQQRLASLTNTGRLVWAGENVRSRARTMLQPALSFSITEPSIIAGTYDIGQAAFGPKLSQTPFSGRLVQALDASNTDGASTTDGCSAFSNGDAISGNVAVVDRGGCTFVAKSLAAQAAGATALLIIDNSRETCIAPALGGENADVRIPVISIGARDGDLLKAQLASTVRGSVLSEPTQLAGASRDGYVRLYAPCTVEGGSSKHHFDVAATPNLLMEPSVNSDLLHGVDLTVYLLLDLGWTQPERTGRTLLRRR
jgi:hypothetical protein